jgi:hypothetical protein
MRGRITRSAFTRYAVAWLYLAAVCAAEIAYALLPPSDQAAVLRWASTSVYNLQHDPIGSLLASAFFTQGYLLAWPALIALALFGANHALGNWRTAVTCVAGHVAGTLVSEGIVGYRVSHGVLTPDNRYLIDVGMSYVVVSAIAVALLYGGWLARAAAALDFLLLIFVGRIFAGLGQLYVSAVGHVIALLTGAVVGTFLIRQRRRKARALFGLRFRILWVESRPAADKLSSLRASPGSRGVGTGVAGANYSLP